MNEDTPSADSSRVTTFQLYVAIEGVKTELALQRAMLEAIVVKQIDHEQRMRSVERWKLSVPVSVLLALATIVGSIITRAGG
jgi:hypothetical protein